MPRLPLMLIFLLLTPLLAGCSVGGSATLQSTGSAASLSPDLRMVAYRSEHETAADIYLTDLSLADLDPGADLSTLSGSLIHLHLFVLPRAGRTPIDDTASSVTIRYVVLAEGAIGVYGGGGFLLPSGRPGGGTFGGRIRGATMKLIAVNETFHDPLGACEFEANVRAPRDEGRARLMAARLDQILRAVEPVEAESGRR